MRYNILKSFKILIIFVTMLAVLPLSTTAAVFAEQSYKCESGEHEYSVTITKEPTETEDGERTYKCDICGYTYSTPISSIGHKWSKWITDKEPTCGTEGHKHRVCTKHPDNPHTEEKAIPATGKHYYVGKITTKPTCENEGVKTFTCTGCGDTYTEPLPALGHSFGEWITDKEPTADKEGHRYRTCMNNPEHIEEEILPVLMVSATAEKSNKIKKSKETTNVMDIVLSICILGIVTGFGCAIFSDLRLIFWMKRKRKDYVNKMSTEWYN